MSTDYSLYYVTGPVPDGVDFFESLEEACKGGVTVVQIREKTASTREFLEIARKAKRITDKYKVPLLINDRLDIALAVGCGLHVGQDDMPAGLARRLLGPDQLLGVSVNTAAEMQEVLDEQVADYVGIGPVYATPTKKDHDQPLGIRGIRELLAVMGASPIKAVAIGGLNGDTIPSVMARAPALIDCGNTLYRSLDGVACVSAISLSLEPKKAAESLAGLVRNSHQAGPVSKQQWQDTSNLANVASLVLQKLRQTPPAVCHNITNQVVMNDTANITLAFSSSPIMSGSPEEAADLGAITGALVLNMGTLNDRQVTAATIAGRTANAKSKPVVLDPVGVGATKYRRTTMAQLIDDVQMTVIKGNAGEIGALAGLSEVASRGVDSGGEAFKDPVAVVRDLALREKTIVAMSGAIDYVSDGTRVVAIHNGHEYQGNITGSGCMCSATIACFLSVAEEHDDLSAVIAGIVAYNVAAELAADRPDVKGPNTFRAALIDECFHITPEKLKELARVEILAS